MRVMVIVKASKDRRQGAAKDRTPRRDGQIQRRIGESGRDAGGRRLAIKRQGEARQIFGRQADDHRRPFPRNQGSIADFWLWQVKSIDDAIESLKRSPFDGGAELKCGRFLKTCDSCDQLKPELREQDEQFRRQAGANQ